MAGLLMGTAADCSSQPAAVSSAGGSTAASVAAPVKRTAKEGAAMQTSNPAIATRIPMEGGTKVKIIFGDTVIHGVLNNSETAGHSLKNCHIRYI